MEAFDRLYEIASQQHGFVLRREARAAGLGRAAVRAAIDRGEWIAEGPRVLRRSGAPWSRASPLMRAVLDAGPGAVVSDTTAASWWGVPSFDLRRIVISRPRGLTGSRATFADVVHTVVDLAHDQVTVLDGIPIVRPERLALELFASVHPLRAARAVEAMWSMRLLSGPSLRRIHGDLAERGRTGTVALRAFLDEHPDDWVPPASGIEARTMHLLRAGGLGDFRRQVDLGDAERWVGRVDFVHTTLPLVVEVQSERHHTALLDVAHDAARKAALEAAGFVVVEVWDTDVWYRRDTVVAAVRGGLRQAVARRAA